ncbi:MAG TPA: hypothetical protein VFG66_13290 [Gemmatimonadales bacterium]|nr:hypothetical protein [Gemmatimonadales bacterium]
MSRFEAAASVGAPLSRRLLEPAVAPIASRQLRVLPSGRRVLLEIDAPRRRRAGGWTCAYRIEGLGPVRTGNAPGEDGIEALQSALAAVRRELEPFGGRLTWRGEPGELGLPHLVPDYFGGEFRRRLERLVQAETEREARRLKGLATSR